MNAFLKKCNKCGLEKPLSDFHKQTASKNGLSNYCKSCKKEQDRKYRIKNSADLKIKKKKYYEKNKNTSKFKENNLNYRRVNCDKIKKWQKEYHKKNSNKKKEYDTLYYKRNKDNIIKKVNAYRIDNKEIIRDRKKIHRDKNKEVIKIKKKIFYEKNKVKILKQKLEYFNTEHGKLMKTKVAHKRRLSKENTDDGTITIDFLKQLANDTKHCIFTGIELTPQNRHLDHIIPLSRGGKHSADNVRFISGKANVMKCNKLDSEFELKIIKEKNN